ncbi:hypothetical protein [Bacillus sp. FJAT-45350]|uniref:hypothetical protein n=1 Tax=Bacillus sp. FJAT-45350 TaxID=2011014 RepID=UPI000BB8F847|nr:hypothetical protein [Bacillus sp. FJAT-45350]
MSGRITEENFLNSFEELIKYFSNSPIKNTNNQFNTTKEFLNQFSGDVMLVNMVETSATSEAIIPNEKTTQKFTDFVRLIERTEFNNGLIPYDKITECVFVHTPQEMLYIFTSDLRQHGDSYFSITAEVESDSDSESDYDKNKKAFYKIIRHIDLALIQKHNFANLKLRDMDKLKKENDELSRLYTALKKEAETQYKNMLTQFISILGIFAAILMGAFGAIQGFTSLFSNADKLSLGKILIISSIGASSVILILFLLLNAIAKLTDRSLSSCNKNNAPILEKHPTLGISYGILILISLIGATLELSNVHLQVAWQGLWWLLPIFWLIYMIIALFNRDALFFIHQKKVKRYNFIVDRID